MTEATWPIQWTFTGDIDQCHQYRDYARSMLAALKNDLDLGVNLGQSVKRTVLSDGTEIEVMTLPGVDTIRMHAPFEEEEAEELEEEEQCWPYLWVGARIISGGTTSETPIPGEDPLQYDCRVIMYVFEPPPEEPENCCTSGADITDVFGPGGTYQIETIPNEVQVVANILRPGHRAPVEPLQGPPVVSPFGGIFVKRINPLQVGNYLQAQYTDNGLVMVYSNLGGQRNMDGFYGGAYDPEGEDDDHTWYTTAWMDPLAPELNFQNTIRRKFAGGYSEPVNNIGSTAEFQETAFQIRGKTMPGNYVVKCCVTIPIGCSQGLERPIGVEVQARVGRQGYGRKVASVEWYTNYVSEYYRDSCCYGAYDFGHDVPEYTWAEYEGGYGPCPHDVNWWQGAFLIDAQNCKITTRPYYAMLGDERYRFTTPKDIDCSDVWTDYPFEDSPVVPRSCEAGLTCVGYPEDPHAPIYPQIFPWWQSTPSGGLYAAYLVGRRAKVICVAQQGSLTAALALEGFIGENGFAYTNEGVVVIEDPDHPNYNGEVWNATSVNFDGLTLGEYVYVSYTAGSRAVLVYHESELGGLADITLLAEPGIFDSQYNPPPNY
jgi:hypothetical protein